MFDLLRHDPVLFLKKSLGSFSGHIITTYMFIGSLLTFIPKYNFFLEMVVGCAIRALTCYYVLDFFYANKVKLPIWKTLLVVFLFFNIKGSEIILNGANMCVDLAFLFSILSLKSSSFIKKFLYSLLAVFSHGLAIPLLLVNIFTSASKKKWLQTVVSLCLLVFVFLVIIQFDRSPQVSKGAFSLFDSIKTLFGLTSLAIQPVHFWLSIGFVNFFFFILVAFNTITSVKKKSSESTQALITFFSFSTIILLLISFAKRYPDFSLLNIGRNAYYSAPLVIFMLIAMEYFYPRKILNYVYGLFIFVCAIFSNLDTYKVIQANHIIRASAEAAFYKECPQPSTGIFLGAVQTSVSSIEASLKPLYQWHLKELPPRFDIINLNESVTPIRLTLQKNIYGDFSHLRGMLPESEQRPLAVFIGKKMVPPVILGCAIVLSYTSTENEIRINLEHFDPLFKDQFWVYAVYKNKTLVHPIVLNDSL